MLSVCNRCRFVRKPEAPQEGWWRLGVQMGPEKWECRSALEIDRRTHPITGALKSEDFPLCELKNDDGKCRDFLGREGPSTIRDEGR